MSLAHLWDQPVVKPRPSRVVRHLRDAEPAQARSYHELKYSGPVELQPEQGKVEPKPAAKPRVAMTKAERLRRRREQRAALSPEELARLRKKHAEWMRQRREALKKAQTD